MTTFTFGQGEKATFSEESTAADLLTVVFNDIFGEIDVLSRPLTNFKGEKVGEKTVFRHVPTNIQIDDPKSAHDLLKSLIAALNELS